MNDPLHDSDLNPPIPLEAIELQTRAVELRRQGWSYEAIADELSDERHGYTPWGAYAWCNPDKAPAQIAAWMKKHHPDPEEWTFQYLAKHNPDALRRLEQQAQREVEYIRAKGLE